jgi:hypothetical protein
MPPVSAKATNEIDNELVEIKPTPPLLLKVLFNPKLRFANGRRFTDPKPAMIKGWLARVPAEMLTLHNWIVWKYVGAAQRKLLFQFDGTCADSTDPATWGRFDDATEAFSGGSYVGIGFVFDGTHFTGVDLDHCFNSGMRLKQWAKPIVSALQNAGAYMEISPSGDGLKIWVRDLCSRRPTRNKISVDGDSASAIEIYTVDRYFTVTGNAYGPPIEEIGTCDVAAILPKFFEPPRAVEEKVSPRKQLFEVKQLIELASHARNGAKFVALMNGDDSVLKKDKSKSGGDFEFCKMLAFWTGKNPAQMDRIFRGSKRHRPKWDEQHGESTYGQATMSNAIGATTNVYTPPSDEKESQAQRLQMLVTHAGVELFHDENGGTFATFQAEHGWETCSLSSKHFKDWLSYLYYQRFDGVPNAAALNDALNVLKGRAKFDGELQRVFVRVGSLDGKIYLDLADEQHRVVEISTDGWNVLEGNSPVRFIRKSGCQALPLPVPDGSVEELRPFINTSTPPHDIKNDETFRLFVGALVMGFKPTGPYPIVNVGGPQGAAKTGTCEIIRACLDPNVALLRSVPKEVRGLMISAQNNWILGFDNVSNLSADMAEAFCRMATGGGQAERELYTDDDEKIIQASRMVILNGISDASTRPDFLDRCLILRVAPIADSVRKAKEEVVSEFEKARPRILGALLDAVVCALKHYPAVKIKSL